MKFNRKTVKAGSFTLILTAALLAVLIFVNLFINELPSSLTSIDTTKTKLFTIGDETKQVLSSLDKDVDIYMIHSTESKDSSSIEDIELFIKQYENENSHISYSVVDPEDYPQFTSQFTEDPVSDGSVIVSCGDKNKIIRADEWYMVETSDGKMSINEYQMYYYYSGQALDGTPKFYAETNLTSAIEYVSQDTASAVYCLSGHGEADISGTFGDFMSEAGIEKIPLDLISGTGEIPEDCTAIFIISPTTDITKDEAEKLTVFFNNGGTIMLVTDLNINAFSTERMPNVCALAASMGMKTEDGIVFEGSTANYAQQPYYLIPDAANGCPDELEIDPTLTYILPIFTPIEEAEGTGAVFHPIFTTSDKAYVKALADIQDPEKSLEKADSDKEGPFCVAAVSTLDAGEGKEAKCFWFTGSSFLNSNFDIGGNSKLFKSILKWTFNKDVISSIDGKILANGTLMVSESATNSYSALLQLVIPAAVIIAGLAVWIIRRRKK